MLTGPRNVAEIAERIVAIVRFGPPTPADGWRPGEYYQVTIDPHKFSPCGGFIRFGTYGGDELVGWQNAEQIFVVSVIRSWPDEVAVELLELPWGVSPALECE
jgi:hypothetical protein